MDSKDHSPHTREPWLRPSPSRGRYPLRMFPTSATKVAAVRRRAPAKMTMECPPCAFPQPRSGCPAPSAQDSTSPPSLAAGERACPQQYSSARESYRCRKALGCAAGFSSPLLGWRGYLVPLLRGQRFVIHVENGTDAVFTDG